MKRSGDGWWERVWYAVYAGIVSLIVIAGAVIGATLLVLAWLEREAR